MRMEPVSLFANPTPTRKEGDTVKKLTDEQIAAYLQDPNHCPRCGSSRYIDAPGQKDWQFVCWGCGLEWVEVHIGLPSEPDPLPTNIKIDEEATASHEQEIARRTNAKEATP